MMVLRRTVGQAIRIGDDIRIVVTEREAGGRVHLGIEAPATISIHRLEVYERIQTENCSAANGNTMEWLREVANAEEQSRVEG